MDPKVEQNQESKLHKILNAAFDAFLKYGVKRTSMADIAEGAEMSRAALYLHFKNKSDILQSLVEIYYAQGAAQAEQALNTQGTVVDQFKAGFLALTGDAFRALLSSPHGAEFMDAKIAAKETVAAGNASLVALFANWMTDQSNAGRLEFKQIDADPIAVATTMMKALEGLKSDAPSYEDYAARRDQLATLFGKALEV